MQHTLRIASTLTKLLWQATFTEDDSYDVEETEMHSMTAAQQD